MGPTLGSQPAGTGHAGPFLGVSAQLHGGAGRRAWHTCQHGPVAPGAAQVHQVDLPDAALVHEAGPEVHPAGGELQLGHGHDGPQGHHLAGDRTFNLVGTG